MKMSCLCVFVLSDRANGILEFDENFFISCMCVKHCCLVYVDRGFINLICFTHFVVLLRTDFKTYLQRKSALTFIYFTFSQTLIPDTKHFAYVKYFLTR